MPVAFTTRSGFDHTSVGSIAVGDKSYELHEALQEGGGYVVVPDDDTLLQVVLDEHPVMKRSTLKAAEEAQTKAAKKAERRKEPAAAPITPTTQGREGSPTARGRSI